jgi:hypothetical protein
LTKIDSYGVSFYAEIYENLQSKYDSKLQGLSDAKLAFDVSIESKPLFSIEDGEKFTRLVEKYLRLGIRKESND